MKKTVLALGVAVVLLLALLFFSDQARRDASRSRYVFDTAQVEAVERLHVQLQDDSVTLVKREGRWVVMPDGFPADSARVALALGRLLRLEDREVVSVSPDTARLMDFGLHAGEVKRVSWTADGATTLIHLGHTSGIDFNSTFWKHPERAEVYRTPGNFTHEIGAHARDWKDKRLFPAFEPEDVRALGVRWRDEAGRLVAYDITVGEDSVFRMTVPGRADTVVMPAANGRALFGYAPQVVIDEIPEPGDPHAGLAAADTPSVSLAITLRAGGTYTLKVAVETGEYAYFHHPSHGAVVALYTTRLAQFKKTPAQLLAPVPASPDEWEEVSMPGSRD